LTERETLHYYIYMRMIINRNHPNEIDGHPHTKQRQLLLELIRQANGHIDAKKLFELAVNKDSHISLATVYRSLSLFKQLELIEEKRLGQAHCYYEIKNSIQHQHLFCSRCGKVIDFNCPLGEMISNVKKEKGFRVTKAEVYLEGYCSECAEQKSQKTMPNKIA
jgi:Fur family transcriptional regulator, ferric uptake regulator